MLDVRLAIAGELERFAAPHDGEGETGDSLLAHFIADRVVDRVGAGWRRQQHCRRQNDWSG